MRRRPTADAPSPSSADVSAADAASSAPTAAETPAVDFIAPAAADADTPSVPSRRATPRRKKITEPDAAPAPVEAVSAAETVPVPKVPTEAEPKKTTRRRKKADAEVSATSVAEPTSTTPALATETPQVVVTASAEDAAPPAEVPPTVATSAKRGPRRRAQVPPAEAPSELVAAPVETPALFDPVPEETVLTPAAEAVPPAARSGRRRNNRRTDAAVSAEDATPPAPVVEVAAAVPLAEEVPAENAASSRRRGNRRRSTPADAVTPPAAATLSAPTTPAAPPAKAVPAPPVAEPGSNRPRRVRGLPRSRETAVAATGDTTTAAAIVAGRIVPPTIVEPLTPSYQPLPAEVLARLPEVRVQSHRNRPVLTVNGEARVPLWFFVNTQDEESLPVAVRQIRMAYEAGIRFFSLLAHLPWKSRTGERRFGPLDDVLQMMAENAPDALFVPRLIFSPPASWERANPSEMARYEGSNEPGDVSLASHLFWEGEADEALRAAIEYIAQSDHAPRVAGFYLEHGEWLHDKERGPDISDANLSGFRAWLKAKYKALVNLRAAWHDGSVTFENAQIPSSDAQPANQTLFWGERQHRWVDFAQYGSETATSVIVRLAKSAKEASGNRSAVAVSYGYTLEIMRANSGHGDLARVLASPHVDILTGPVSYSGRLPGGSAPLPVPLDSVHLAGKLWISEDDTKTFLASGETPDTYNPKITAPEGAWAVHSRNFGAALARGAGLSWMDLWGEGWLDDRYVWQNIAHLNDIAERLARLRQSETDAGETGPDVAVFVDEKSFFDVPPASEAFLSRLVADQRDVLLRSGAKIGFYLLSDLLNPQFPQTPRLLLFLNAFHLPDTIRTAIKSHQDNGKTLAWLFGPGCRDENLSESVEAVGIQIRLQPWGSKTGTTVLSNVRSPLTENLRGQKVGDEARINPSFYVPDPKAQVLGEYVGGLPSLAIRKHPRWQSVFLGEPGLTLPLVRGLYKMAGVPTYTVDDDAAVLGDGILSLHSAPGGGTTVHLYDDSVLFDLLSGETVASGGFGARLSLPPQGTRLLFAGTPGQVRALNGDPDAAPLGLSEDELPPPAPAFVFEAPLVSASAPPPAAVLIPPPIMPRTPQGRRQPNAAPVAAPPSEDVDLMEAAFLSDDFSLADKENEPVSDAVALDAAASPSAETEAAAAEAKKKRRRRRRGPNRTAAPEGETDTDADLAPSTDDGDETNATEPSLFADTEAAPEPSRTGTVGAPPVTVPPGPPVRLTLEELLPQSTRVEEQGELPPIPDELLPLNTVSSMASPVAQEAGPQPTNGDGNDIASPAITEDAAPRKRRGRPRRALTSAADAAESEASPPDGE